jgi:hypothetical protein
LSIAIARRWRLHPFGLSNVTVNVSEPRAVVVIGPLMSV